MIHWTAKGRNVLKTTLSAIGSRFGGDSLKARCARSGAVLGVTAFVAKFLAFGSKMLLTRLLVPEDMGLMVMIVSLTALFEVLTEVGIKQSVIQHKEGGQADYLNMAWWFQTIRGIGLYLTAFLVAPYVCEFYFQSKAEIVARYSMGDLVSLVRVAFLTILFNGSVSPRAYVLEKEFKFGKAALITQGSFILGTVATVILALALRNVWAIAIGSTSVSFFRCLLSYILCPCLPRLTYHRESLVALYQFARGMLGLPLLTYVAFQTDLLVAGKLIEASVVGYYGMARHLALAPRDLFVRVISPVLLPAFAEKQEDNLALRRAVLKLTRAIGVVVLPGVAFAIACGQAILPLVYGDPEYATVALAFGILCIYVAILIQGSVFAGIYFGTGRPQKHRTFVALRSFLLVALIYPATRVSGVTGAAVAVMASSAVAMSVQVVGMRRMIGLRVRDYLMAWVPGLLLALPVGAVLWLLQSVRPEWRTAHLVVGAGCCLASLGVGLLILARQGRKAP